MAERSEATALDSWISVWPKIDVKIYHMTELSEARLSSRFFDVNFTGPIKVKTNHIHIANNGLGVANRNVNFIDNLLH